MKSATLKMIATVTATIMMISSASFAETTCKHSGLGRLGDHTAATQTQTNSAAASSAVQ